MEQPDMVYFAWEAPRYRGLYVVGVLTKKEDKFIFRYTQGAITAMEEDKFDPIIGMIDLKTVYISQELFPIFKNRLLSKKRPEYSKFIYYLGLEDKDPEDITPITIFARSRGLRMTDRYQLFEKIEIQKDGYFEHIFFINEEGNLADSAEKRTLNLVENEVLTLAADDASTLDKNAVLVLARDPVEIIGYCPNYLSKYIRPLLYRKDIELKVSVKRLSKEGPTDYRLMCKLEGKSSFNFMEGNEFIPISPLP